MDTRRIREIMRHIISKTVFNLARIGHVCFVFLTHFMLDVRDASFERFKMTYQGMCSINSQEEHALFIFVVVFLITLFNFSVFVAAYILTDIFRFARIILSKFCYDPTTRRFVIMEFRQIN